LLTEQDKSPTDYIAHVIAVQNKFTALGKVLEDKEDVLQYAFGCQPEYGGLPKFEA
jgi:hypothetical protein